jgi:hypothetical protein
MKKWGYTNISVMNKSKECKELEELGLGMLASLQGLLPQITTLGQQHQSL